MLVRTLDARDFHHIMYDFGRDNFTFDGYSALIEYYDEFYLEPVEIDPVSICCSFTEDRAIAIWDSYSYLFPDFPKPDVYSDWFDEWCIGFVEELNYHTWARYLDNGNIILADF